MTVPDDFNHARTMDAVQMAFRQFALFALLVPADHVDASREAVSRAESIGFVIDPTAYRRALSSGSLERQRELLNLFVKVRADLARIFPGDAAQLLEQLEPVL